MENVRLISLLWGNGHTCMSLTQTSCISGLQPSTTYHLKQLISISNITNAKLNFLVIITFDLLQYVSFHKNLSSSIHQAIKTQEVSLTLSFPDLINLLPPSQTILITGCLLYVTSNCNSSLSILNLPVSAGPSLLTDQLTFMPLSNPFSTKQPNYLFRK